MLGSALASGPAGLSGGSGATWGTFATEVEYGDIFPNWRGLSRNGPDVWDLSLCGHQLLLFRYLSGLEELTDAAILGI